MIIFHHSILLFGNTVVGYNMPIFSSSVIEKSEETLIFLFRWWNVNILNVHLNEIQGNPNKKKI